MPVTSRGMRIRPDTRYKGLEKALKGILRNLENLTQEQKELPDIADSIYVCKQVLKGKYDVTK